MYGVITYDALEYTAKDALASVHVYEVPEVIN
jgi:hypothetical protein